MSIYVVGTNEGYTGGTDRWLTWHTDEAEAVAAAKALRVHRTQFGMVMLLRDDGTVDDYWLECGDSDADRPYHPRTREPYLPHADVVVRWADG